MNIFIYSFYVFKYFCKLQYTLSLSQIKYGAMRFYALLSMMSTLNLKYFFVYTQILTNIDILYSNIISKSINFLNFKWNRYLFEVRQYERYSSLG